jgi:ABC-2 type transport system permease protein
MSSFAKYFRIYGVQLKNNFVREAVYRSNFFTMLAVDFIWMCVEFSLFNVIYANVDNLGGWTKPQVFFFLGVFFASDSLFSMLFSTSFWRFSDLVNKGELDILLTKPASALFLAMSRSISFTSLFNVLLGLGIIFRFSEPAGFEGGLLWLALPVWLLIGVVVAFNLRFFFAIWCFWTERGWAFVRLYYEFFQIATKPDSIYPQIVRYSLMTFLPFAFIGSVPARALLQGLQPIEYAQLVSVLIGFGSVNTLLWRAGLRRYQSASS